MEPAVSCLALSRSPKCRLLHRSHSEPCSVAMVPEQFWISGMQTAKYNNKVAVVATLSHLADGKSRIRYISLCRYFLYQTVSNNHAWFTDRLECGNHTHICQSTARSAGWCDGYVVLDTRNRIAKSGAVHHSSPTQSHRLRCCRRIRGGICWVSVM